jgi:hypothetical protein
MRRLLSILLLAILGLGPATSAIPALASGVLSWTGKIDESRLPACCRRGGKHHCALAGGTEQASSSGETTVAANDTCPFAPQMMAATATPVAAVVTPAFHPTLLASELCVLLAAVTLAVLASRRSQPKRGPPTLQML